MSPPLSPFLRCQSLNLFLLTLFFFHHYSMNSCSKWNISLIIIEKMDLPPSPCLVTATLLFCCALCHRCSSPPPPPPSTPIAMPHIMIPPLSSRSPLRRCRHCHRPLQSCHRHRPLPLQCPTMLIAAAAAAVHNCAAVHQLCRCLLRHRGSSYTAAHPPLSNCTACWGACGLAGVAGREDGGHGSGGRPGSGR